MTRLEKIEQEIKALSPEDAKKFIHWYDQWRNDLWDEQMERDAKSGKLDKLIGEAKADIAAGRVTPL